MNAKVVSEWPNRVATSLKNSVRVEARNVVSGTSLSGEVSMSPFGPWRASHNERSGFRMVDVVGGVLGAFMLCIGLVGCLGDEISSSTEGGMCPWATSRTPQISPCVGSCGFGLRVGVLDETCGDVDA